MKYRVISVGKPSLAYAKAGIEEYLKRLKRHASVEWIAVRESGDPATNSKRQLERAGNDPILLLDEKGELLRTREMADRLGQKRDQGQTRLSILIGGADGHGEEARARAWQTWALGRITLQHELALLVWCEQLYRIHTLWAGSPYHREG